MKTISILGSTGSIGTQTLEVVDDFKDIKVCGLSAGSNIELLEEQIRKYRPLLAVVYDEEKGAVLKDKVSDLSVKIETGMEGLLHLASMDEADIVVTAIVGMIGIRPTIEAINNHKDIALANKETLVCAGHIIMPLAKEKQVKILPVDSEHSAIFQALRGNEEKNIEKIWLTASGGPFRGRKEEELLDVKVSDALNHPNWTMGSKITIDSATMVNKGLEVIEVKWLFGVPIDDVEVIIQPQSIIHSMVEYIDGSVIAQLGIPDMKLPIQYALFYPQRRSMSQERLDFRTLKSIEFENPDMDTFYGLKLAYIAGRRGGSMPTVFNAANELAVKKFLNKEINFLEIYEIIEDCIKNHTVIESPTVEQILETEQETYKRINSRR